MKLKTILLPLLMLAVLVSMASAEYIFPGNVSVQSLKADINALVLENYGNETAINESIAALVMAAYVNETAINVSISNLGVGQTAQNDTLANLALGQTAQNNSITAIQGYDAKLNVIGGGLPGNFTLTGAAAGDALAGVIYFNATTGNVTTLTDLSTEFSIPDTNILNQTYSGTSSLNGYLLVSWIDKTS